MRRSILVPCVFLLTVVLSACAPMTVATVQMPVTSTAQPAPATAIPSPLPSPTDVPATATPSKAVKAPTATWRADIPLPGLDVDPVWLGNVDAGGRVYLMEAPGSIGVYGQDGKLVNRIGKPGKGPGEFNFGEVRTPLYPEQVQGAALAFLPDGLLVVGDGGNHRVQVLDADGKFLREWGRQGAEDGQFEVPWAVAVDSSGNIYVGDFSGTIQKFDASGKFLARIGSGRGFGDGKFVGAVDDIGVDDQGNIFAADVKSGNILKFDAAGQFVKRWNKCGDRLLSVRGLAVTPEGALYVADGSGQRVCVFDADGSLLGTWGEPGKGEGQFRIGDYAADLTILPTGVAYVADPRNKRLQVFELAW